MDSELRVLAQALALIGLMGATIEYCEILRRRALHRHWLAEQRAASSSGLQGLVRLFLIDR